MPSHPIGSFNDSAVPLCTCVITVWSTAPGAFAARAVLPDGTLREFSSAFELAQLLGSVGWLPVPAARGGPGLR